jgi:hypothetical protein
MQEIEKTSGKKAKITLRNILAVLQAYSRKAIRAMGFELPIHQWEQIIYRRHSVILKSPECWSSGHCVECGCEILGKTMEDRPCEQKIPCYPAMMGKEEWEAYKKEYNIRLFK